MSWQIDNYGQTHHNKCSECLPLALAHALRRFRHWLIAWSVTLCWIPNHASIVSSGTFAECLSVWCVPCTDLREMPVSLAIWRIVLCIPGAPSWLSTKSLTASMFSALRDVRGLQLPGCPSVVPVSLSFLKKIIQTAQTPSLLWKLFN